MNTYSIRLMTVLAIKKYNSDRECGPRGGWFSAKDLHTTLNDRKKEMNKPNQPWFIQSFDSYVGWMQKKKIKLSMKCSESLQEKPGDVCTGSTVSARCWHAKDPRAAALRWDGPFASRVSIWESQAHSRRQMPTAGLSRRKNGTLLGVGMVGINLQIEHFLRFSSNLDQGYQWRFPEFLCFYNCRFPKS